MDNFPAFPVKPFLTKIRSELVKNPILLLRAEPGAGKTTLVPGALLDLFPGGIYLLEPRRVAARAAARRIASLLGEKTGERCGYIVRGENRTSRNTRLFVVTQGVLTRMLQQDVELGGAGLVIFDEFHERSLDADLNLTLLLDIRKNLNPDLRLLIMSATIDLEKISSSLGQVCRIDVPGRAFPVEHRYLAESVSEIKRYSRMAAETVRLSRETPGDLLLFLPGVREIDRMAELLAADFSQDHTLLFKLHGLADAKEQDRALAPAPAGMRKIILATNIAESSLTIDGITAVIDSGLERKLVYSPNSGISTLETCPISKYSTEQRAGRAGRTAPGISLEMATRLEHDRRIDSNEPEILSADLAPLALELAGWSADDNNLEWLDAPPAGALAAGRELLRELGAVDVKGKLLPTGRELLKLPLHPRLGKLMLEARKLNQTALGAEIAALVSERDRGSRFSGAGLEERILAMRRTPDDFRSQRQLRDQLLELLHESYRELPTDKAGLLLALAYPDRIGKRRTNRAGNYSFLGGQGGVLEEFDPLRKNEYLVGAVLGPNHSGDRLIRLAAALDETEVLEYFGHLLSEETEAVFDTNSERAVGKRIRKLGNLVLSSTPAPLDPAESTKLVLAEAENRQLPFIPEECEEANRLMARLQFACRTDPEHYPEPAKLRDALPPLLPGIRTIAEWRKADWNAALRQAVDYEIKKRLDTEYPEFFSPPSGKLRKIDYSTEIPCLSVQVQELYGIKIHPTVGRKHLPLKLELLSPARRPIQTTGDLPGFWQGSWSLVRKEMRGRYPKHDWPENPAEAAPPAHKPFSK